MKHPLPESPFPSAHFSQEDCLEYRNMAMTLVDECLDEYEDFVVTQNRTVSKRKWKEIKTIEKVAVYKKMTKEEARMARAPTTSTMSSISSSRESSSSSSSSSGKSFSLAYHWELPKMICVGKVVGTLDDVMYGIVTPDKEAMRVNTTYIEDEYIDSRVLCSMQCPRENRPFQFLGIKWAVKGPGSIVRPRDLVFLEATGIKMRPNGERFGYWVQHSVDVAEFDELKALGIVRSRQSWTSVFRETTNGSVEVYMRVYADPGGKISERLAVQATANSLLTIWNVPSCAHNKKLAWLMRDSSSKRSPKDLAKAKAEKSKCCSLCSKSVGMLATLTTCELCLCKICSKCLTMRKLSYMRQTGQVFSVPTGFCKNCITRGAKTSSADISVLEYVPDAPDREPQIIDTSEIFNSRRRESARSAHSHSETPRSATPPYTIKTPQSSRVPSSRVTDSLFDSGRGGTPLYVNLADGRESSRYATQPHAPTKSNPHTQHKAVPLPHPQLPRGLSLPSQTLHPQQLTPPPPHPNMMAYGDATKPEDHRRQLWMQMNQLRLQAEEAYWQTKRNAVAMDEERY